MWLSPFGLGRKRSGGEAWQNSRRISFDDDHLQVRRAEEFFGDGPITKREERIVITLNV